MLLILNIKLANLAIFLPNWIKMSNYYNIFNWLILSINQIETFKLINKPLNFVLFYYKLIDKLKR